MSFAADDGQEALMHRLLAVVLLVAASTFSGGCYLMQDQNGQWWACEDYQTPNGVASGCVPVQP
jgi:hypothetical protein